jgi:methylmalonyl-CoA/ethylmalonyl-CoA epimerase
MVKRNMFGSEAIFDHIGLAVKSIKDSIDDELTIISDEIQNVSVAFVELNGIRLELIEPFGEKTPITADLEKGRRLVHLCFRVPNMEIAIKNGRANGFHCIAKPVPAKAFNHKRIAWLFSNVYGLVELLEA